MDRESVYVACHVALGAAKELDEAPFAAMQSIRYPLVLCLPARMCNQFCRELFARLLTLRPQLLLCRVRLERRTEDVVLKTPSLQLLVPCSFL